MSEHPNRLETLRIEADLASTLGETLLEGLEPGLRTRFHTLIEGLRVYQAELEMQNQELIETQSRIAHAQQRYQTLYDNLPAPCLVVDARGLIHEINRAAQEVFVTLGAGPRGPRSVYSLLVDHNDSALAKLIRNGGEGSKAVPVEVHLRTTAEVHRAFRVSAAQVPDQDSGELRLQLLFHDMSPELQLAEQAQRLQNVVWGADVGTWEWNALTGETRFNARWAEIVGHALAELEPVSIATWQHLVHPEDLVRSDEALRACMAGERELYECEVRMRHRSGEWVWVLDRGRVITRLPDGRPEWLAGTHLDINQRKRLTEQLRESETLYRLVQAATGFGLWDWRVQKDVIQWDATASAMLGFPPVPRSLSFVDWQHLVHPDDLRAIEPTLQDKLSRGDDFNMEVRYRTVEGGWLWVRGQGQVVERDPQGRPVRMVGTHINIHDQKLAEHSLADSLHSLGQSNAELEQFAYAASHDLRQPLRMINNYLQILERRLEPVLNEETGRMLRFASDGAKRMDEMLVALLEYSRVGRVGEPMQWLESRALLDEVLHILEPEITATAANVAVSGQWPRVFVSREEFLRLLQNLIHNALKYHAEDRAPVLRLSASHCDSGHCFVIEDEGIGIDPAEIPKLFKVFQRLQGRDRFEGSGIGLAICRKIVERHGGVITVESEGVNRGTRFSFSLPVSNPKQGHRRDV